MAFIIIRALATILLILALSHLAGRTKFPGTADVSPLNVFLMDCALPGSLFRSSLQTPRRDIVARGPLILVLAPSTWTAYAPAYLFAMPAWNRSDPRSEGKAPTTALPNYAAPGFPILYGLFGEKTGTTPPVAIAV